MEPDGSILGDPSNISLTRAAELLGWKGQKTRWDILPIIIEIPGQEPKWFELPEELVLQVPISHPEYPWFEELGLRWYAIPGNLLSDIFFKIFFLIF